MKKATRVLCAGALAFAAGSSAFGADFFVPLNWNWNGLVHAEEFGLPDELNGFRSISDRSLSIDGGSNSLGTNTILGATGISYDIVRVGNVLDVVHLGNTGPNTARPWDDIVDGDNLGVPPTWLPSFDAHTVPQVTDVTASNLTFDANASIGFLYFISNGGGNFLVDLTFTDNTVVTVTLRGNDWFGATNPPAAQPGVASQTRLGNTTYTGTSNNDNPILQNWPTQSLAVTEAVITVQSLQQAGLGNVVGKQLASITFRNPTQVTRGHAIMACTVVTGLGPPANDTCANATEVFAGSTSTENLRATGNTTTPCGTSDTTDVWYRYTATGAGLVQASTCGAPFDTTLAVYSACGGTLIACDDNDCGLGSRVRWSGVPGTTYFIRVAGNNAATGQFNLDIAAGPTVYNDVTLPLAFNWNGLVHQGEDGVPDAPNGYRSIADRGMTATGALGEVNAGTLRGTDDLPYAVVDQPGVLDTVNLGTRGFDGGVDGDNIGITPDWFTPAGVQRTNLASLNHFMGADTRVGVIYQISNGGGIFDCTLEFSDGTSTTVTLDAPDWFTSQIPNPPFPGVEVQRELGVYTATDNFDLAEGGAPGLNVVEATFSTSSLINAGFGDVTGKRLVSIVFSNPSAPAGRGYGIFAATLRNPAPPAGNIPPSGVGAASPNPAEAGRNVRFSVNVAAGLNPPSTNLTVTSDLSTLGGAPNQSLVDNGTNGDLVAGDGIYSYVMTLSPAQLAGQYSLSFAINDAQGRSAGGNYTLDVTPFTWNETLDGLGDAGELPGSHQTPQGSGAMGGIAGALTSGDVDMYLIEICDSAGFTASTITTATFDSQLFLFDANGLGITLNDDTGGAGSFISGAFVPQPGNYYLAISQYDRDPVDELGQELWLDAPFGGERAPDGPGAASPVQAWAGTSGGGGTYTIVLSGACFPQVGPTCDPDVNCDGSPDQGDVACMILAVAGDTSCICQDPDFNQDGSADQGDVAAIIGVVAGQPCP